MKAINPIEDIRKLIEVLEEDTSLLAETRLVFNSGVRLKWLEEFSSKSRWSYKTWHEVGEFLLRNSVIPDLRTLNSLNQYCNQYNIDPLKLILSV